MANTRGSAGRATVRNCGSEKVNQTPSQNPTVNLKEETTHHSDQPTTAEKPRRRGHPKAMATTNMVTDNSDQVPASMERQPRKRVRKDTLLPTSELVSQPASKRAKTNDTGNDQPVNHQGKATSKRKAANVAPPIRSPLPERTGRNIHPAPKKGTRRTPQEVQAEREAHKKAIEEKIWELEEAKRLLAEANAAEDIEDDTMGKNNPQRLSTAIHKRQHIDFEGDSDGGEAFDFRDVDAMSDSSESEEPAKQKVVSIRVNYRLNLETDWICI